MTAGGRRPATCPAPGPGPAAERARLDKWLFVARLFRSRALAAAAVAEGAVRVNGRRVTRPAQPVGPGDVLTLVRGGQVQLLEIAALAPRRGGAAVAAALYRLRAPAAAGAADRGAPGAATA